MMTLMMAILLAFSTVEEVRINWSECCEDQDAQNELMNITPKAWGSFYTYTHMVTVRDIISFDEFMNLEEWLFHNISIANYGEDSILIVCESNLIVINWLRQHDMRNTDLWPSFRKLLIMKERDGK
jgi:hypothetical protein